MKVTKMTLVCEALSINKKINKTIEENKMGFLLCPSSQMDTLEEASNKHGVSIDKILEMFNSYSKKID